MAPNEGCTLGYTEVLFDRPLDRSQLMSFKAISGSVLTIMNSEKILKRNCSWVPSLTLEIFWVVHKAFWDLNEGPPNKMDMSSIITH